MEAFVAVLDLDGVVIKSNLVKHRAMLSLFSEYPRLEARISDYILANGGVPRLNKFEAILTDIVQTEVSEGLLQQYLDRYAAALDRELTVAPLVDGVDSFLVESRHQFYVSSSAPDGEVRDQLSRRNLLKRFSAVYGSSTPKHEALSQVRERHSASHVVFFGDSVGDFEAAVEAKVAFVAVTCERDNFAGRDVVKLVDFKSRRIVENCMRKAVERAT